MRQLQVHEPPSHQGAVLMNQGVHHVNVRVVQGKEFQRIGGVNLGRDG